MGFKDWFSAKNKSKVNEPPSQNSINHYPFHYYNDEIIKSIKINDKLATSIVKQIPILNDGISKIRGAVSNLPFEVSEDNVTDKSEQEALFNALNSPFRGYDRVSFKRRIIWDMMVRGYSDLAVTKMILPQSNSYRIFLEPLNHVEWVQEYDVQNDVKYITNGNKRLYYLNKYEQVQNESFALRINGDELERDQYSSPLLAAMNAANLFSALYNQATGILANKPAISGIAFMKTTDHKVISDFENNLRRFSRGDEKQGGILVAGGEDFDFKSLSFGLEKLLSPETHKQAKEDMANALGIPLELLGLGNTTYANKAQATADFYRDTVLNRYGYPILSALNTLVEDGNGLIINEEKMSAFVGERIISMQEMAKVDFLTEDEKREAWGYKPLNRVKPNENK